MTPVTARQKIICQVYKHGSIDPKQLDIQGIKTTSVNQLVSRLVVDKLLMRQGGALWLTKEGLIKYQSILDTPEKVDMPTTKEVRQLLKNSKVALTNKEICQALLPGEINKKQFNAIRYILIRMITAGEARAIGKGFVAAGSAIRVEAPIDTEKAANLRLFHFGI